MTDPPFAHYYALLERLHEELRPRGYVEIGVADGHSLGLARPGTVAVGIDPAPGPELARRAPGRTVVATTSDDFFATHTREEALGGAPLDLAFVDGLHHVEAALADLAHLEAWAHPGTVVLVHDCHPTDERMAARERTTVAWAGDVWRLVPCLRAERPDLRVTTVDVGPTGLAVITGFGAGGFGDLAATLAPYRDLPYATLAADPAGLLALVPPTWSAVAPLVGRA